MRRYIYLLALLLPAIATAGARAYDVAPIRDLNGWGEGNREVTQTLRCTFDSALYAEVFIGQPVGTQTYHFEIWASDGNDWLYRGNSQLVTQGWTYVRANLERNPAVPMPRKGTDLILKVKGTGDQDSVNWYASDADAYTYGQMTVPGRPVPANYDLAARVEGVCYNQPGLPGTWDLLPPGYLHGWAPRAVFEQGFHTMKELGFRATRLADCWYLVQPDSSRPDYFDWARTDSFWELMASESIQAHLVTNPPVRAWQLHDSSDAYAAGLFGPLDTLNLTFAYYRRYAQRYGPGGSFWDQHRDDLPYLPLRCVECINEPVYAAATNWWRHGSFRDTVVQRMRDADTNGAYVSLYARYCQVVDAALKSASESIMTQIYCPNDVSGEPFTAHDWLEELNQRGIAAKLIGSNLDT